MARRRRVSADGIGIMGLPDGAYAPAPHLTPEHRMLLQMRETLYDGVWADFEHDLRARLAEQPYVFETIAPSDDVKATIRMHLEMIRQMREWESATGSRLDAGSSADGKPVE